MGGYSVEIEQLQDNLFVLVVPEVDGVQRVTIVTRPLKPTGVQKVDVLDGYSLFMIRMAARRSLS
jgi:hypothetical protein